MSGRLPAPPVRRGNVNLYLPGLDGIAGADVSTNARSEPRAEESCSHGEQDDDDDLDRLLNQYENEALLAKERVAATSRPVPDAEKGMAQRRDEGLATPLAPDTKGYQLLAKMGYKPGEGIGKSTAGRVAPLDINLKAGRGGLGIDEDRKRRKNAIRQEQEERAAKRAKGEKQMQATYMGTAAAGFVQREAEKHVRAAQKVCETLDTRAGIEASPRWLAQPSAAEEDEEEDEPEGWQALPISEKLQDILGYLRSTYHYCIFCGCQYGDAADLEQNCPGENESDH